QRIRLTHRPSARSYPSALRRVRYFDALTGKSFVFLTNHLELDALMVAELYRRRWHVELFFRWIKQHLRLRWFFATTPNGVRLQIWSALCAHLLVAIARARHRLEASLYQILQIVSVCIWEKTPLSELLTKSPPQDRQTDFCDLLKINDS
ncbi:MAG TPA: transposase, partial [Candidatus Didemnitutus sp.]|nr:transposase [Candidatus Didemnitutus sp.]